MSRTTLLRLALLATTLILAPLTYSQDASTGALRGTVFDPDGRPLPAELAHRRGVLRHQRSGGPLRPRTPSPRRLLRACGNQGHVAAGLSYMYVHGQNLIRARDVNLPVPVNVRYPVFDATGTNFLGTYLDVPSFSTWQVTRSMTCPWPPCINPLARPISQLGAINEYDSEASSFYHGATLSLQRRMTNGLYFRLAYTYSHAYDDGQDALVAGRPATVQNPYSTTSERGPSVTDQRQRFVLSVIEQPTLFGREHAILAKVFNDWKLSGVVTVGSGRPVDAKVSGDPNQDGNSNNDRLPGYGRNAFLGHDYATADLRLTRRLFLRPRYKIELVAEAFNAFNRDNQRVVITDDGFNSTATDFVQLDKTIGIKYFPAYYAVPANLTKATSAYAPRQIQFALKFIF